MDKSMPEINYLDKSTDEMVKEVYAHFGLAMYQAQVLEHAFGFRRL
jgi:hypothetical protein